MVTFSCASIFHRWRVGFPASFTSCANPDRLMRSEISRYLPRSRSAAVKPMSRSIVPACRSKPTSPLL